MDALDRSSRRARMAFQLILTGFVLVCSFVYGLVSGVNKQGQDARAALDYPRTPALRFLEVPRNVMVIPIGREVEIDGNPAEMVTFVTNEDVKSLTGMQVKRWQQRGFVTVGASSGKRGVAFAKDPKSGAKYSLLVALVPPEVRNRISQGFSAQGTMTVIYGEDGSKCGGGQCEVPGIPVLSGGTAGAVFSSLDPGGRGYSGIYSVPGTVDDAKVAYKELLVSNGWKSISSFAGTGADLDLGALRVVRNTEEADLLFAPQGRDLNKTVIVVTKRVYCPQSCFSELAR